MKVVLTSLFLLISFKCSIVYTVRRFGVLTEDAVGVSILSLYVLIF